MKRSIWTILLVLVLSAMLVACGAPAADTGAASDADTSEEAAPKGAEEEADSEEADPEETEATDSTEISEIANEAGEELEVVVIEGYTPEGTLEIGHSVNHITWDPHKDQRTISLQYLNLVYEGLLRETTDGRAFIPELAIGWEEDETGVTFTLREGVTFHDGTPFNADAVVANFDRLKADGHNVNKGFMSSVESAEAIDEMTVRYNYSAFDGTILLTLSRFAGKMISPAAFDTVNENNPVGTGPYIYNAEESTPDNSFKVYDFNPNYWNNNAQPVARVELSHVTDGATRVNTLRAGEFHTAGVSAIPVMKQLEDEGYIISTQPAVGWSAHILDRTGSIVPELADERVRQAMSYALNREAYWQVVNPGEPTTQHAMPGGYAFSEDIEDLNFDMEKALALMEEAGNPTFTIDVPSYGAFNARNAFLASSWEPLGISLNLIEVSNIFAGCTQAQGDFPIGICPINERHIKHFVENRLLEGGFLNPFGHVDEDINALYEQAAPLPLDEAEPLYAEIAKLSAERGYILHLGWAAVPVAYDPERISGVDVRFIYPGTYYAGDVELLD
ncbi:MAG: ABC transporter substrate-binding protein [Chloroflexota bacterium]